MTVDELKNQLFKLSAQAIYHISNGSKDVITVQEAIEKNGLFRPIVYSVQILNVLNQSDSEIITFVFSPNYLIENSDLVLGYGLNEIMWTYSLPRYDIDEPEIVADDVTGKIEITTEEGVVSWLSRGTIEIKQTGAKCYDLSVEDFSTRYFAQKAIKTSCISLIGDELSLGS
jgi:hypothetical protein